MTINTASARYEGLGMEGKGNISTASGVFKNQPYGFGTRFGEDNGTNPEELVAAAHAACFTMALSFALSRAGYSGGQIDTSCSVTLEKDGDGFTVTKSALSVTATVDGIEADEFAELATGAKEGCPISKLYNCEITLDHQLG